VQGRGIETKKKKKASLHASGRETVEAPKKIHQSDTRVTQGGGMHLTRPSPREADRGAALGEGIYGHRHAKQRKGPERDWSWGTCTPRHNGVREKCGQRENRVFARGTGCKSCRKVRFPSTEPCRREEEKRAETSSPPLRKRKRVGGQRGCGLKGKDLLLAKQGSIGHG